jgi:long-subunit fatty acid transport protein
LLFAASLFAQGGTGVNMGVGTSAFAFSGNHTAVVNDLSAVYWNPAAMAFLPVREFQASFDIMRTNGKSEVTGSDVSPLQEAKMSSYRDRLRLRGFGAMFAIPTSQGGLTLALSYEKPFAFDDFSTYGYNYGDTQIAENNLIYGDLNRWSGAFGVQVAPEVAAGLTVSLITGDDKKIFDQRINGNYYNDMELSYSYLGYSLNGGLLYIPSDYLRIGFNINMMMYLGVSEEISGRWFQGEDLLEYPPLDGRAYRAPYGAIGVGVTLPWLIVALDFRFVMPYGFILPGEKIPDDSQAKDFKVGTGIGLEVPIPVAPVVLRAGY